VEEGREGRAIRMRDATPALTAAESATVGFAELKGLWLSIVLGLAACFLKVGLTTLAQLACDRSVTEHVTGQ
jgi:hypothetical protein